MLTLLNRAEVRGRKRRRIQEEEELFTSSTVQVGLTSHFLIAPHIERESYVLEQKGLTCCSKEYKEHSVAGVYDANGGVH